jgi:hypothetical protein
MTAGRGGRITVLRWRNEVDSGIRYGEGARLQDEAAVNDANGAYLLYREMTALSPILFIAVPLIGAVSEASWVNTIVAMLGVSIEYLLLMLAARHAGTRLVSNVLAIEAARPMQAGQSATPTPRPRKAAEPKNKRAPEI